MIVYSATKEQFNNDVILNQISDKILNKLRKKNISGGESREYMSWQNSLVFMRNVLDDPQIPNDSVVAIEYQIPRTSKRVDFIIAGSAEDNSDSIVIVELKQWSKAEKVDDDMQYTVKAFTGGGNRIVPHPSYQAYSYSMFIKNSSEQVQDNDIRIVPCAYLHNYQDEYRNQLSDEIYEKWYDEAPFFIKNQVIEMKNFIKKYIKKKSIDNDLLYKIDNGRIRPSKALQDCIVSLVKGNEEFLLLDDQIVAYDICRKTMLQCKKRFKGKNNHYSGWTRYRKVSSSS